MVFRNGKLKVWDSGNVFVEDYVRSCKIINRHDIHLRRDWLDAYYSCFDYIHTGYVALSLTTKILFYNEICDKFL